LILSASYQSVLIHLFFSYFETINQNILEPEHGAMTERKSSSRKGLNQSSIFPVKLLKLLSNPEYSHIIRWMPHGRSWRVLQPDLFSKELLPKYFSNQSKYASFMRQVNGWGFKRITRGEDRNSYYHELFVRDNPHLAMTMSRKKASEDEGKEEPNFYEITGMGSNSSEYARSIPSQSYRGYAASPDVGFDYREEHLSHGSYERAQFSSIEPHQFHSSQSIHPPLSNHYLPYPGTSNNNHYHPYAELSNQRNVGYAPYYDYSNYPSNSNFSSTNSEWSNPHYPEDVDLTPPPQYDHYGPPSHYPSQVRSSRTIAEDKTWNLPHRNDQIGRSEDYGYKGQMGYSH